MKFTWPIIVLCIIGIIIILVVIQIIQIRIAYGTIFKWWGSNGGNQYNKDFNLFAVLSSSSSYIFYAFSNLFGTLYNHINRAQILFLMNRIFRYIRIPGADYNPNQFVLPTHIVNKISFQKGDGDRLFNNFLKETGYDDSVPANIAGGTNGEKPYRKPATDAAYGGATGVYPLTSDVEGWKNLMLIWGVDSWKSYNDANSFLVPSFGDDDDTATKNEKEWFDPVAHPDNFFSRYGIGPGCPLVVAFANQAYDDPTTGIVLDSVSLKHLLGDQTPGGWAGFLVSQRDTYSEDDYLTYIDSKYLTLRTTPPGGTNTCSSATVAANWMSAIFGGVGVGAGIYMAIAGLGFWPAAIIGVVSALGTSISSVITSSQTCKSEI